MALCNYATVAQDGKISIDGIFDQLIVEKFPAGIIDKFFVSTVSGEPNETYTLTLKLEKVGNGKNLLNLTTVNAKISPNGKHNWIVRLANVGFEDEGNYDFKIYNDNKEINSTSLDVIRAGDNQGQTRVKN